MSDFTAAIGHLGKASLKSVSYPDIFMDCSIVEQLQTVMPGQPTDWYVRIRKLIESGVMPMPMIGSVQVVETYRSPPQPPTTTKPAPPPNVVSEATKAKLLDLCNKCPEMAEYRVAPERSWTKSEERAWQRAIDKLTAENEKAMEEKVKLYSNFGFYS
jgi:hypothetical protein